MSSKALTGIQWMIFILTIVAVLTFLKWTQTVALPVVLSVFLAFLLSPVVQFLTRKKVPGPIATLLALILGGMFLSVMGYLVWSSLLAIEKELPFYLGKLRVLVQRIDALVADQGISLKNYLPAVQQHLTEWMGQLANILISMFKSSLIIFFITMFALLESMRFRIKARRAFGEENKLTKAMGQIAHEIKRYVLYKTLISLLTGILVWATLSLVGLDFALTWGLLAFILNFIPSVGSIMASVPPIVLALLQFADPIQGAIIVTLILVAIQVSIGNFLDPKIMGDSLNISALVIFVSMICWGWMWGPMGMLIAVPLAVCIKVIASHVDKLRPIAILMEGR